MTMQASAYGRLGQEPKPIQTRTGKSMAVCSMAVDVDAHGTDDTTVWLGLVAFGQVADDLLRHDKGEMVSVFGSVKKNVFTTGQGEVREQLQIVADGIVSARSSRPGRKKPAGKQSVGKSDQLPLEHVPDAGNMVRDLNDEVPW